MGTQNTTLLPNQREVGGLIIVHREGRVQTITPEGMSGGELKRWKETHKDEIEKAQNELDEYAKNNN